MDTQTSDNDLARLAAKGDREAFRQLLERHYDTIYRIAFRFCRHREEAEDAAQDICVSLPAKLKSYEGRSAFSTWLYRVVLNRVRDIKRSQVTAARAHTEYGEVDYLRKEEEKATKREIAWLNELMEQLPQDLSETAVLVVGEGMNHREAADVLGLRESTISWRMGELKKALRQMAKEDA
ncbi:MAG: RNA polymerase sigma factor [Pseudomonadota bacterium]